MVKLDNRCSWKVNVKAVDITAEKFTFEFGNKSLKYSLFLTVLVIFFHDHQFSRFLLPYFLSKPKLLFVHH